MNIVLVTKTRYRLSGVIFEGTIIEPLAMMPVKLTTCGWYLPCDHLILDMNEQSVSFPLSKVSFKLVVNVK